MTRSERLLAGAVLGSIVLSALTVIMGVRGEKFTEDASRHFYATYCGYIDELRSQKLYRYRCYDRVEESSLKPQAYAAVIE